MRNIDLESLHIFKTVADCGGISRAAVQLNRVQSNITTRVQNLEKRLGVNLFLRQGGKLLLSGEGQLLLGYAERLLRLSDEAESALRSGQPRGTLRLGTMESTAAARLPQLLAAYHRRYPDVQIELVSGTSAALVGKVQRGELEAAFVAATAAPQALPAQAAFMEELVLIAPRDGLPARLQQCTVIAFSSGCSYRRILEDWLAEQQVAPARVLELGSYHAIVACVAAGSGIGIVPRSVLKVVRAEPELSVSALPPRLARVPTMLVYGAAERSVALTALCEQLAPLPAAAVLVA